MSASESEPKNMTFYSYFIVVMVLFPCLPKSWLLYDDDYDNSSEPGLSDEDPRCSNLSLLAEGEPRCSRR